MTTYNDQLYHLGGAPVATDSSGNMFGDAWFVDNSDGSDSNDGKTVSSAVATIALAVSRAGANDTIYVRGTGTDYDESVIVTQAGLTLKAVGPRMECGWTADEDATVLDINAAGVTVDGFFFRPNGTTTGIAIDVSEAVSDDRDGCVIKNNIFKSNTNTCQTAILANGSPGYIKVLNNHFTWCGYGIYISSVPTSVATGWEIIGNYFSDKCTNGIYAPMRRALIQGNSFNTMTVALDTVGYAAVGDYNSVHGNYLDGAYANDLYVACTNDCWAGNYSMDTGESGVGASGITILNPTTEEG